MSGQDFPIVGFEYNPGMSRRWILPAVLLVLLFTASLIHVESGTLGVLRGAAGGRAFILEPGLHFRIPFLQRLLVYPVGLFKLDFPWEVSSREGNQVRLQVHFEGIILRESLIEFSQRATVRNGPTVVRDDVGAWIRKWAAQQSSVEFPQQPLDISDRFAAAAKTNGFQIRSLTVMREIGSAGPAGTDGALPSARPTGVKVVILGLDGADWQILDPLIAQGSVPHLARLKKEGAWANLRSMDPMLSPLLWTTLATGHPPEEHGVMDFMVPDPRTGKPSPVSSASRKVRALWNLFSQAGMSSDVVAWWATWPAEAIRGTLVSDRVAYSLFSQGSATPPRGMVFPESYAARIAQIEVSPDRLVAADLQPFVDVTEAELGDLRRKAAADPHLAARDPVLHLARILAATRTYQAIGMDLLSRGQADLFALYYQGIDEISHRFAHFADPKMDMVSEADHRRFRGAVRAFYVYQDRLLGEILGRLDPGSLVIVVSDHGFKSGAARPKDHPPDLEGQPARWHRPYGIFIAWGVDVEPGEKDPMSLLDIAPTVLCAAGIPAAADMPGRVRADLFKSSLAKRLPPARVPTYERSRWAGAGSDEAGGADDAGASQAMEENLRALGYIGAGAGRPSGDSGTAFSHAALAGIHLQKGNLAAAESEAKRALKIEPKYLPALVYLAEIYEKQKRYDAALPLARQAAASDSPDRQSGLFLLVANLYVAMGKGREGLKDLQSFLPRHAAESDLYSALGIVKEALGDAAGARAEYARALARDALAQEPIKHLFVLDRKEGRLPELLAVLQAATQKNPDSAFHAAYLGLTLEALGKERDAATEYQRALKVDPEYVVALVNWAGLLARQRNLEAAVPLYRRALAKDPASAEARVGLGAALSIQGKNEEAVATLEEGEHLGIATPALYNALAMAYYQARRKEKAIGTLKESLRLDPSQSSARSLLAEWEKP
jgi:tetratricopeptide (TPR) repeat protein